MKLGLQFWLLGYLIVFGGGAMVVANLRKKPAAVQQTLPSPYWTDDDDIPYFAPGPEFKLQREAAAMKAYKSDLEAQQAGRKEY